MKVRSRTKGGRVVRTPPSGIHVWEEGPQASDTLPRTCRGPQAASGAGREAQSEGGCGRMAPLQPDPASPSRGAATARPGRLRGVLRAKRRRRTNGSKASGQLGAWPRPRNAAKSAAGFSPARPRPARSPFAPGRERKLHAETSLAASCGSRRAGVAAAALRAD